MDLEFGMTDCLLYHKGCCMRILSDKQVGGLVLAQLPKDFEYAQTSMTESQTWSMGLHIHFLGYSGETQSSLHRQQHKLATKHITGNWNAVTGKVIVEDQRSIPMSHWQWSYVMGLQCYSLCSL